MFHWLELRAFCHATEDEDRVVAALHAQGAGRSAEVFAQLIAADPVSFGFRGRAARLTMREWTVLSRFLLSCVQEG